MSVNDVAAGTCVELPEEFGGPVEAQGDLGLIAVEVIAAYAGYRLHVSVILLQHISVVFCGR